MHGNGRDSNSERRKITRKPQDEGEREKEEECGIEQNKLSYIRIRSARERERRDGR
jgi:hypothetical protein